MFSTVSEAFLFLRPNGLNSPIQHLFNTFTAKATSSIQNFQPVEKCADSNLPNVSISPVGGEITPLEAHPTSRSLQPLEKSSRKPALQRAKHPASGKKRDACCDAHCCDTRHDTPEQCTARNSRAIPGDPPSKRRPGLHHKHGALQIRPCRA